MNIFIHESNGTQIAELQSEGIVIRTARDAAEIAKDLLVRGLDKLIVHERNLCPEFWQTSNGLARSILQEFASKAVVVAFVGKLSQSKDKSFLVSIEESSPSNQAHFLETVALAKMQLSSRA